MTQSPSGGNFSEKTQPANPRPHANFQKRNVFLVHFKPWDLSRKMRREISIDFTTGIIDFENKNISIVQKQ